MLNIKRILFPTDLTPLAEGAFAYAGQLAARHQAELHVLHVAAPNKEVERAPIDFLPLVEHEEGDRFFLPVDGFPDNPAHRHQSVPVYYRLVHCISPVMGILEYADEKQVDLIMMATHGRTGLDRLLSGSVTEEVVREAHCPTFSVRTDAGAPRPIQRLLVPVDFSEYTPRQVDYAATLADTYDADLTFLHVIEDQRLPDEYRSDVEETASASTVQALHQRARDALRRLAEDARPGDHTPSIQLAAGHPVREIMRVAEEQGTGLIVMATRGRAGLERMLGGSVAERVVRGAKCPVLTVPRTDHAMFEEDAASSESAPP